MLNSEPIPSNSSMIIIDEYGAQDRLNIPSAIHVGKDSDDPTTKTVLRNLVNSKVSPIELLKHVSTDDES